MKLKLTAGIIALTLVILACGIEPQLALTYQPSFICEPNSTVIIDIPDPVGPLNLVYLCKKQDDKTECTIVDEND